MKFSCEKYLLQNATATAARAAAAKSPIPALEGLLIEAGSDVKITGYDLKKGIYTYLEADVAEPGSVVLGARLFGEMIRRMKPHIFRQGFSSKPESSNELVGAEHGLCPAVWQGPPVCQ